MEDETEPLLQRADMLWREGNLHDTDQLYGHQRAALEQVIQRPRRHTRPSRG